MQKYVSRGHLISKSAHHPDLYIIDNMEGKFHFLNTGAEVIRAMYPADPPKIKVKLMICSNKTI